MLSGKDMTLPSPYNAGQNFPTVVIAGGAVLHIAQETTYSHFYVELQPQSMVSATFEVPKETDQAHTLELVCGLPGHEEKLVIDRIGK